MPVAPPPGQLRRLPQRTCVACRQVKPKRELIRLVSRPEGGAEIDTTGKKAGRGAYLCPSLNCWELGLKKKRLDYALRTTLSQESREELYRLAQTLPQVKRTPEGKEGEAE